MNDAPTAAERVCAIADLIRQYDKEYERSRTQDSLLARARSRLTRLRKPAVGTKPGK